MVSEAMVSKGLVSKLSSFLLGINAFESNTFAPILYDHLAISNVKLNGFERNNLKWFRINVSTILYLSPIFSKDIV